MKQTLDDLLPNHTPSAVDGNGAQVLRHSPIANDWKVIYVCQNMVSTVTRLAQNNDFKDVQHRPARRLAE
jgi:hypothetical protein